jgi:hypothetical protein
MWKRRKKPFRGRRIRVPPLPEARNHAPPNRVLIGAVLIAVGLDE